MAPSMQTSASPSEHFPVSLLTCTSYQRQEVQEQMGHLLRRAGILPQKSQATRQITDQNAHLALDATESSAEQLHTRDVTATENGGQILQASVFPLRRTMQVVVKPNLLRGQALACSHAEVVRALCLCLQEEGIRVRVLDSPGFGTAQGVAKKIGLTAALAPLGIAVEEFSQPKLLRLPYDLGTWHIGHEAFEADALISVPRLKAHTQMRLTLGVKNLFGCICGLRKALAHTVQGRTLEDFCLCILALYAALPPTAAVLDAVVAMHKRGPAGGETFPLHCLGASTCAQALDTAVYSMLGLQPEQIPLWRQAQMAQLPQQAQQGQAVQQECMQEQSSSEYKGKLTMLQAAAFAKNITYTDALPTHFPAQGFILPQDLKDISFQPHRLLLSYMRRLWRRYF